MKSHQGLHQGPEARLERPVSSDSEKRGVLREATLERRVILEKRLSQADVPDESFDRRMLRKDCRVDTSFVRRMSRMDTTLERRMSR